MERSIERIRNAVYGEEVRDAICEALEECNSKCEKIQESIDDVVREAIERLSEGEMVISQRQFRIEIEEIKKEMTDLNSRVNDLQDKLRALSLTYYKASENNHANVEQIVEHYLNETIIKRLRMLEKTLPEETQRIRNSFDNSLRKLKIDLEQQIREIPQG